MLKAASSKEPVWSFSFAALIFISTLVTMSVSVIIPAMPIIMKLSGFSYSFITYTFVGLIIGRFISSNQVGSLMDRHMPHKILLFTFFLHMITMCSFAFVTSEWLFILLRFLEGVFEGVSSVVLQVMVIALSKPENRGRKMGIFASSFGVGFIIGPAIGGFALQLGGPKAVFFSVAVLMLFGFLWLLAVYQVLAAQITLQAAAKRSFDLGFLKFLPLYSGAILQRALYVALSILLPMYLVDRFHLSPYQVGFYFTGSAVITTILMPITGRLADQGDRLRIVIGSIAAMGLSVMAFALLDNKYTFTIMYVIETIAFSFMVPAAMKVFGDHVDSHPRRGQIVGAASSSRELVNIVLICCVVPMYKYEQRLPWIVLGGLSLLLTLPYISALKRQSLVSCEVEGS